MVSIWQVYFDQASHKSCDPAWNHYDNSLNLNEFFENQVIADLIEKGEHLKDKYFGVFSHDTVETNINFREEGLHFSPENLEKIIEKHDIDVFSFCKRREAENIVTQAERWHKGYMNIMNQVLEHCDIKLPHKLNKIVLFNLMICKSEFWTNYYQDLLKPAMEALKNIPEAYENSQYERAARKDMTDGRADRFMKAWRKPYYPFHPFICERLASIYLQLHPEYSFKQIF